MTTASREREVGGTQWDYVKEWTDRELLIGCIQNVNDAWRELMRRYDAPLRGVVYKRLKDSERRLPSDYREDVMGAFYLKLLENEMRALRCFNWEKGTAIFKWFSFLVVQCAVDYFRDALDTPEHEPLTAALEVPEDGGILMSGRSGPRCSLAARVRQQKARAERAQQKRLREDRRRARRTSTKTTR